MYNDEEGGLEKKLLESTETAKVRSFLVIARSSGFWLQDIGRHCGRKGNVGRAMFPIPPKAMPAWLILKDQGPCHQLNPGKKNAQTCRN